MELEIADIPIIELGERYVQVVRASCVGALVQRVAYADGAHKARPLMFSGQNGDENHVVETLATHW